jgi:hypothetical protein
MAPWAAAVSGPHLTSTQCSPLACVNHHYAVLTYTWVARCYCAAVLNITSTAKVSFQAGFQKWEKRLLASSCPSSAPTGRIWIKLDVWVSLENLSRKFKFRSNLVRITGTLHEDRYTFLITSRSVLLRIRNASDESCRENQNILWSVPFFSEKTSLYEITWKNLEPGRPQMTVWRMRIACWIPKATNTHSEHVILIDFPLQKWLKERALPLRYTCIDCLVRRHLILWTTSVCFKHSPVLTRSFAITRLYYSKPVSLTC